MPARIHDKPHRTDRLQRRPGLPQHEQHDADHQAGDHGTGQHLAHRAAHELVLRSSLATIGGREGIGGGEGVAAGVGIHERGERSIVDGDLQGIGERRVGLSGGLNVHSVVNGSLGVTSGHDSAATAAVAGDTGEFDTGHIVEVDHR